MFKLFAQSGCGSMAVEAALSVCAAPHEIEYLSRGPDRKFAESFHRINPMGQVPTLILPDDAVMTESAAILIYLGDLHPQSRLAPEPASPLRPRFLRWLVFLATAVYPSDLRYYYPERHSTGPEAADGIKAQAALDMGRQLGIFAEALGPGPFVLGDAMCAVDLYAAMMASWTPDGAALFAAHPNLEILCGRVAAHPAVAEVWARNGL